MLTSNLTSGTVSSGTTLIYGANGPSWNEITINTNTIMQNKVAVFKVTRDEDEKIVKTEFLKELWIETKNGQSVEFQVARDKDLAKYEGSELSIKIISTLAF